jgi:hypothetical protein
VETNNTYIKDYDTGVRVVSFNGTGESEILSSGNASPSTKEKLFVWQTLSDDYHAGFTPDVQWDRTIGNFFNRPGYSPYLARYADVNGDGLTDFMFDYDDATLWLNDGHHSFVATNTPIATHPPEFRICDFVDVTGDGRTEFICTYYDYNMGTPTSTIAAFGDQSDWSKRRLNIPINLHPLFGVNFADLNGDGLTDILRCGPGQITCLQPVSETKTAWTLAMRDCAWSILTAMD